MKLQTMLITPEIATELLKSNTFNRPINQTLVHYYANEMRNGFWKSDTGESIKIAKSGKLLDGQHRLAAIVKSGVSITMLIIDDLSEDVFSVIDTGKQRTASDTLSIAGFKNYVSIAASMRRYFLLKNGNTGKGSLWQKSVTNNQKLLAEYNTRPEFWQHTANFATRESKAFSNVLPISEIGGLYAYLYDFDNVLAETFIIQVCSGIGITNDTVIHLRNLLIKDKLSLRSVSISIRTAWILKTWNAIRTNKKLKQLKFTASTETYPEPI